MMRGGIEPREARACESLTSMSVYAGKGISVDPRWTGIVEVLVRSLAGTVLWEPGSVVLQLPDRTHAGRLGDLDALRLCLVRMGLPVVFDTSRAARPDPSLRDFLRRLVESGLMVDIRRQAA